MESTEPLGILWMLRPAKVIVKCIDASILPDITVRKIVFDTSSGSAAETTATPLLITTGATGAKNLGGKLKVMTPPASRFVSGVNDIVTLASTFPT
jgi:hypothetical protein